MSAKFSEISLERCFNAAADLTKQKGRGRAWHPELKKRIRDLPRGKQTFWGIPFKLGPEALSKKGLILLTGPSSQVEIPVRKTARYVCFLHVADLYRNTVPGLGGGELLAEYVLQYKDGSEHVQPIRRLFEVNMFLPGFGHTPFCAVEARRPGVATPQNTPSWGMLQTGVGGHFGLILGLQCWIYALQNPDPEKPITSLVLRGVADARVAVLGATCYNGPGHPLRHVPRRVYKLTLPANEKTTANKLDAEVDMGIITRTYAVPTKINPDWLKAGDTGLGRTTPPQKPTREFLVEATVAEGADLTAQVPKGNKHVLPIGAAFTGKTVSSQGGKARIEVLHPSTTWVYVNVLDAATGKPTPTRAHFSGKHGEYIPPYGHHADVNDNWFEDYAGDLKLGDMSYAYVPGRFQIELPVGEVYVELTKGFEYEPTRSRLKIRPGQRELNLKMKRRFDWKAQRWMTADTHVHFISPQTAWLEGQAEGLNLINLLASQWGKLFTNVADITGELSGCSKDDTLVWVGTENRHHLLGHISMLGAHGDPVFPMCAGGIGESYFGDPEYTTLTEWAQTCKEREGVVIRPHFPFPSCEEPVYFALEQLDGAELRRFANPDSGTLDQLCFLEWYRYLNCGYRVAAVGGTDKMSAGMPVGGVRTYAQLGRSDAMTFENWGKAIRAGRTFTTSGPLIGLTVEGKQLGDEIKLDHSGTLEFEAHCESIWPQNRLELVVNGKVVASTVSKEGQKRLRLRGKVAIDHSSWIAARCGSRMMVQHCWPIHIGAHTSPIYVIVNKQEIFSPNDASYMLTLIDGGIAYLDTVSVRYNEKRHRQMKAIFENARHRLMHRMGVEHHEHA